MCAQKIILFSFLTSFIVTSNAFALNWNDAGVVPVQSISDHRWRDAVTGQFINVAGMPGIVGTTGTGTTGAGTTGTGTTGAGTTGAGTAGTGTTGAGTTGAGTAGAGTTAAGTTGAGTTGAGAAGAGAAGTGTAGTSIGTRVRTNWTNMKPAAKVGTALGIVGGAAGIYASTAGQEEHSGWNVVGGATSGAAMGSSIGSLIAPGIGTAIGAGAGAVVGGLISGSQLFSETDCLYDPVTGQFTCCNTVFNKGERQANIGDYMFCGIEQEDGTNKMLPPGVRQCLQGSMKDSNSWSDTAASWWDGLWKDDFWQPECTPRICSSFETPTAGIEAYINYVPDPENYCWKWECVDGYERRGNTCIASTSTTPANPYTTPEAPDADQYEVLIQRIQSQRDGIIQRCGYLLNSQGWGV